jgi:transposase
MTDQELHLSVAVQDRNNAQRQYDKANIQLQQACIVLHEQGYSGYRIAQLTGLTKMTIYKWVKNKS